MAARSGLKKAVSEGSVTLADRQHIRPLTLPAKTRPTTKKVRPYDITPAKRLT